MYQTNVYRKSKHTFDVAQLFSEDLVVYETMWKYWKRQTGHRWKYDAARNDAICMPDN